MDNYFANHRGSDGTFVGSSGGIDYSGLTYNDAETAQGLQEIHSRLLAWNPAPSTGLLNDSDNSVLGGIDMKDSKSVAGGAQPTQPWNVFLSGNVVLAQNFSDAATNEAHQDTTTAGMELGVDYAITPHFLVGALFGYGHTWAEPRCLMARTIHSSARAFPLESAPWNLRLVSNGYESAPPL